MSENPVAAALRLRCSDSEVPRDYMAGYVPSPDSSPELTEAALRLANAWMDADEANDD